MTRLNLTDIQLQELLISLRLLFLIISVKYIILLNNCLFSVVFICLWCRQEAGLADVLKWDLANLLCSKLSVISAS